MIGELLLLWPLAWRNLWRNPRRTFITVAVVGIGLWSILVFAALLAAWSSSARQRVEKGMTGAGEIHARGYMDDPTVAHRMARPGAALQAVLRSAAVVARAPRVRLGAIIRSEYRTLPVTLVGVDPAAERELSALPGEIRAGRYLDGPGDPGVVLGRDLATRLHTRVGKRVVIMALDAGGELAERAFPVVGVFAASRQDEDTFCMTGLATAQAFTHIGDELTEIAFNTRSEQALPGVIAALRRAAPGLDIDSWRTLEPVSYGVSTFFSQFILLWLVIMVTLIAIGIVSTQLMAVFERAHELALLQALGMRPRLVLAAVTLESAVLVGIGVLGGATAALATIAAFAPGLDLGFLGRGAETLGAGRVLHPRATAHDLLLYSLTIWLLAVLATLWPAHRASRVSPLEVMARAAGG